MITDARSVADGSRIQTDLCVIGGGPAGISIAREFIARGLQVCLLEAGGFEYDDKTQALYNGENIGHPYYDLNVLRLRFLGGGTNHWGGWCLPLDPIDFEARPGIPDSGWPFGIGHLEPFYRRAAEVCSAGAYEYDPERWEDESRPRLPLAEDKFLSAVMKRARTLFGQVYRDELDRSSNVHLYLYANVVELETNSNASGITSVRVATLQGARFHVDAKVFVLATGGIENPRLLLASNKVQSAGLGNANDLVGRYFMEHLMLPGAMFLPSDPSLSLAYYEEPLSETVQGTGFLRVAPELMRDKKLLNTRILIMPGMAQELALKDSAGVSSAALLWGAIRTRRPPGDLSSHIANVIGDLDKIAIYSYRRAFRSPADPVSLQHQVEQAPDPESRVTLGTELDGLGTPRVRLNWKFGDLERRTLRQVNEALAVEVGRAGLGRIHIVDDDETGWPPGLRGSWHQMGTTKMNADPAHGVVDPDCRVHGIANLFVAGGSVFPTSGTSNPTMTIVALALRLSDHIRDLFKQGM
jgi:choline dehydrogenase-like flavoprotein